MRLWRICSSRHMQTAFSGTGSKLAGGRWTPPGRLAVYTAQHQSTAILEMLVHMNPAHFGTGFILIAADLPDDTTLETVEAADLPANWRLHRDGAGLRQIGSDWLARGESVALLAPSAVAPTDFNVILNPAHPDFARLAIHEPTPYAFDPRLLA